jgi:hypothetical protein
MYETLYACLCVSVTQLKRCVDCLTIGSKAKDKDGILEREIVTM